MIYIKYIVLFSIFGISVMLGFKKADKYRNRVNDLKEIRIILNFLETKIQYTYEPLPNLFQEIYLKFPSSVGKIFQIAKDRMEKYSAGEAWGFAVENSSTNMNFDDLNVLKNLEKLLGKTSIEGQLSEIDLLKRFIDEQIDKANEEARKNEKLYRNLGIITGCAIVIIFI